ncbi:MAG: hypothetical protein ACJAUD_000323 [Crocinitomicaceae bacterium]|jgi:hypothetical protein
MKKTLNTLFLALLGATFLTSCMSSKYYMGDDEIAEKKYSINGWNILKDGVVVGTLTSTEWEIYKNNIVQEISVKTSFTSDKDMQEIARFVHSKFPEHKIEVNDDGGNSFPTNGTQDE